MSAKVYILLDVSTDNLGWVVKNIRSEPGVLAVETLEGSPDIIVEIEASDRFKLEEYTNRILSSVETVMEYSWVLPVRNSSKDHKNPMTPPK